MDYLEECVRKAKELLGQHAMQESIAIKMSSEVAKEILNDHFGNPILKDFEGDIMEGLEKINTAIERFTKEIESIDPKLFEECRKRAEEEKEKFLENKLLEAMIYEINECDKKAYQLPSRFYRRHKSEKWINSRYERKRNNDRRYF